VSELERLRAVAYGVRDARSGLSAETRAGDGSGGGSGAGSTSFLNTCDEPKHESESPLAKEMSRLMQVAGVARASSDGWESRSLGLVGSLDAGPVYDDRM
jgi:hypothetical protein